MAVFEYTALTAEGKKTKGVVDADSVRGARQRLKQRGILPITLIESAEEEAKKSSVLNRNLFVGRVNLLEIAVATRQLATLVGAGFPLVEALKSLGEQLEQPTLKRVIAEVCDAVNEGSQLNQAMRQYPRVFSSLYVNMVASGEASGTLDVVLERLAEILESQADLRRKVTSAALYPLFMLGFCFLVVIALLTFVVPQITKIFDDRKVVLPLPTRIVISLSNFFQDYWMLVFGVIILTILLLVRYRETQRGRRNFDALQLKVKLIGPISLKVATARFARTLGTMLQSGIEMLTALQIVRNIVGNVILEEVVEQAAVGVREGRSLAGELGRAGKFPKLLVHMIAIGEKTGELEPMLLRAAGSYEREVDGVIGNLTKILEPVLILVIAVIVAAILLSIMLPMAEMGSLAG